MAWQEIAVGLCLWLTFPAITMAVSWKMGSVNDHQDCGEAGWLVVGVRISHFGVDEWRRSWLIGSWKWWWSITFDSPIRSRSMMLGSMGVSGERGLWVECHTEEFCVKVLKFEIINSRKSSNYFIRVVLRTIEFVHSVMLFPGRFKNGQFKNREVGTRSLSQN